MPSYDLSCKTCGTEFEIFRQGFLRDEDRCCTSCGSGDVEQLFTGFVLARPTAPPVAGGCCGGSCGCGS